MAAGSVPGAVKGLSVVSLFNDFASEMVYPLLPAFVVGTLGGGAVALGALESIPRDLDEAAEVDGATRWQRLRHITLPHLGPALGPAIALGGIWTFNMFNVIYLVSDGQPGGSTNILVTDAYRWAFRRGHRYGYAAAYAVLIFAVLAIQSALSRRATPEVEA